MALGYINEQDLNLLSLLNNLKWEFANGKDEANSSRLRQVYQLNLLLNERACQFESAKARQKN